MTASPIYKRVLLKVSGEALMGSQGFGIDVAVADRMAADIAEARALGVEVGVVVGGGNIFRGVAVASKGGDRVTGDHMGMLATVINALALATSLRKLNIDTVVLSTQHDDDVAAPATVRVVSEHGDKGAPIIGADGDLLFGHAHGQFGGAFRGRLRPRRRAGQQQDRKGGEEPFHHRPAPST